MLRLAIACAVVAATFACKDGGEVSPNSDSRPATVTKDPKDGGSQTASGPEGPGPQGPAAAPGEPVPAEPDQGDPIEGDPHPGDPSPGDPSPADPSPDPGPQMPPPAPQFGVLGLEGVVGLGRAETVLGAQSYDNLLVSVDGDGTVTPTSIGALIVEDLALVEAAAPRPPEADKVSCVRSLGDAGTLILARHRDAFPPDPLFGATELAVVRPDGHLVPLASGDQLVLVQGEGKCGTSVQKTGDGSVYALDHLGARVWKFDLATGSGAALVSAGADEQIERILPLDGGHLYYDGLVSGAPYSRFRHANGSITELGATTNYLALQASYGAVGVSYLGTGAFGSELLSVDDAGKPVRAFVAKFFSPEINASEIGIWAAPSDVRIGAWDFNGLVALKNGGIEAAANALWRTQYDVQQGVVDVDQQIYFDGANLVKVVYDATDGLRIQHHKNLIHDATKPFRVIAVFGPAQGFVGRWGALATDDGLRADGSRKWRRYWVEIDPETGVVDLSNPYQILATNMPAYWQNNAGLGSEVPPQFTAYRVPITAGGAKLVGLSGTFGAGLVDFVFDDVHKTVTLSTPRSVAYTYQHQNAVVAGSKLYWTASFIDGAGSSANLRKIYTYDADTDIAADVDAAIVPDAAGLADVNTSLCNGTALYGVLRSKGDARLAVAYCDTAFKLRIGRFTDVSFATAQGNIQLLIDTPQTSDDQGDFVAGTNDSTHRMSLNGVDADTFVVGLGRRHEVRIHAASSGNLVQSIPFAELELENRFEYGTAFYEYEVGTAGDLLQGAHTIAPWDATRAFAAAQTPLSNQAAFLVDPAARTLVRIPALDGIKTESAVRLGANRVLVSGFDWPYPPAPAPLVRHAVILDDAGALIEDLHETIPLIRQLAPLP